jgi:hypothetical protein
MTMLLYLLWKRTTVTLNPTSERCLYAHIFRAILH